MALRDLSFTEEERAFLQQRVARLWKAAYLIAPIPGTVVFLLDPGILKTGIWMDRRDPRPDA